jgi:hypothetical protein
MSFSIPESAMQHKMQKTSERERLISAAHRLAKISQGNPVKLFSLLYMLDIRFFRDTGRSCTGETYYAMADGPAPGSLRPLLAMRDMGSNVGIGLLTETDTQGPWLFDSQPYCQHGLTILHELESSHRQTPLRDLSLDDANAWWRVYTHSRGIGAIIPYEMTLLNPVATPLERLAGFAQTLQTRQPMAALANNPRLQAA